jgi:tRNA dimethylallyltransferase
MAAVTGNAYNCIVVLGPTAVGKTALGVKLALEMQGEVISADSRQVYKGLDIGSGKDIGDYTINGITVPFHLIDVADLTQEYSVFDYQQDFNRVFAGLQDRGIFPVIVGGTGLYLDAVVRGYDLMPVTENTALRQQLAGKTLEELDSILLALRPDLHTRASLRDRERTIRFIEIETFMNSGENTAGFSLNKNRPQITPFIIGTSLPRDVLRRNIAGRLKKRLEEGMIQEVRQLHGDGASWERLERLGLEYKYVAEFLQGKIESEQQLFDELNLAIGQFSKRQETWFRGMEKKGVLIHWLPSVPDTDIRIAAALNLINSYIRR